MADEVLVTEFRLNNKMSGPLAALNQQVKGFVGNTNSLASSSLPAMASGFGAVGTVIGAVAGAALLATGAVLGFSNAASEAAGDYEALVKGLEAYAGSAENLAYQLAVLKEAAKAPGLGFEEAIQGAVRLQAAGLGFEMATNAIAEFGNALALVGGGKAELDGVLLALTQIAAKGKISAEELLQIQERVPQIRGVVQKQFGTSDTEQLQKMGISSQQFIQAMIRGLREGLPRAGNSVKNERQNIETELNLAFISIGTEINKSLLPFMKAFSEELNILAKSGVIKQFTQQMLGAVSIFSTGDFKAAFRSFIVELSTLPVVIDRMVQNFASAADILLGAVTFDRDRFARGMAAQVQMSSDEGIKGFINQIQLTRELTGKRLDKSAEEFAKGEKAIERKPEEETSPMVALSKETATNTAKLVDLAQKQFDISRQILGGGTVAGEATSAVRLDRALGGSLSRGERMVLEGMQEIARAYSRTGIAAQRNNGVRGSTQVR